MSYEAVKAVNDVFIEGVRGVNHFTKELKELKFNSSDNEVQR